MEGKEEINGFRVTMNGDDVPASYHIAPRIENNSRPRESPPATDTAIVATAAVMPATVAVPGTEVKKKRGRPRKYSPDGTLAKPLSPMPISASIPLSGDFSGWKHGKSKPMDSFKKKHKLEFENSGNGNQMAYSVGANFTPHVITVNAGEDIMMKIISFSQQGSRAICILAANGTISNVTLRQPNSSGGTLTYEGRFEILSLSGSFMLTDNTVTKSRTGGMSVSLAGPDGRVLGGGLAGLLVAAGPVQVVVGTFLPGHQQEQKQKKNEFKHLATFAATTPAAIAITGADAVYGGLKPIVTPSSTFHREDIGASFNNSAQGSKNSVSENKISFLGVETIEPTPANCEVSC